MFFFKFFIMFFYFCVFIGVKTFTYKYDAFFFSKLRLAIIQFVTYSAFRFLLQ